LLLWIGWMVAEGRRLLFGKGNVQQLLRARLSRRGLALRQSPDVPGGEQSLQRFLDRGASAARFHNQIVRRHAPLARQQAVNRSINRLHFLKRFGVKQTWPGLSRFGNFTPKDFDDQAGQSSSVNAPGNDMSLLLKFAWNSNC